MELFHEYKNKYFHLMLKILNSCGEGLGKEKIIEMIELDGYDEKPISKDLKTFEGIILNEYDDNLNLLKRKDETYYSALNKKDSIPIKIRLSNIEKTWLKGMISEERVQALLGEDIIRKLEQRLENVNEGRNDIIEFTNKNVSEFEDDIKKISKIIFVILEAIDSGKLIMYTNVDRNGNEYKNVLAVPLRIEYSLKDDKFRASVYSIKEKRAIMINLNNLKEISIIEKKSEAKREDIIKGIKESKYCEEPITITLEDRRGAMERCFMSFSSFERSSKLIDKGRYEVDIYYYQFQEEEVISKIISLGPFVVVKGPERIRNKVIDRIKKAYEQFEE